MVKGVSFVDLRDAGDPAEMASFYDREGADELVFLDITASSDGRDTMVDVVRKVSEEVFIPLTVGGGIRSSYNVRLMLEAGADKVSLNTAAVNDPELIRDTAERFGNQCVVVAIDARRIGSNALDLPPGDSDVDTDLALRPDSIWEVVTHGGRTPTGVDAIAWATRVAELGAGELLATSMDTDGQQGGYDNELLRAISERVTVPIIASGGAGELEHLCSAVEKGGADAVLAASIFHFGTFRISEAKAHMAERGLPVRPIG